MQNELFLYTFYLISFIYIFYVIRVILCKKVKRNWFSSAKNVCILWVPKKKNSFCLIRRNACILWVWMGHFEVKWWIFLDWSCEISQSTLFEELVAIRLHTVAILTRIRIYQQAKKEHKQNIHKNQKFLRESWSCGAICVFKVYKTLKTTRFIYEKYDGYKRS